MKVCGFAKIFLLASLIPASAQVTVEVTQEQRQFLQGEALPVAVRITNRSGQTLHLGADEDWLTFTIESREGSIVPKTADPPVKGEFELESSHIATKRVDLAPYFAAIPPGHYGVTATVHVKDWNREIPSPPVFFDVIEGAKLWEQDVGVPAVPGSTNSAPEIRKYILQQATYLRGQIRLYLRVADSYGKTFRVFPIGPMISFGRPESQVDKFNHLHILYQNGPRSFSYSVFDLDGSLLARRTYEYQKTRPRLRMDEDGTVFVVGGVRVVSDSDVPPPSDDEITDSGTVSNTVPIQATNTPPKTAEKVKRKK